jgi:hypothetical protein
MKIQILAIFYALGAALQITRISKNKSAYKEYEEIDDFQIDVDQEVDVVSGHLPVDTTI